MTTKKNVANPSASPDAAQKVAEEMQAAYQVHTLVQLMLSQLQGANMNMQPGFGAGLAPRDPRGMPFGAPSPFVPTAQAPGFPMQYGAMPGYGMPIPTGGAPYGPVPFGPVMSPPTTHMPIPAAPFGPQVAMPMAPMVPMPFANCGVFGCGVDRDAKVG